MSELFVALVAHEFLPARVNHHTPCEVTVLCTQLITHVAFEWLFAGVRLHMSFPGHLKIHAGVKPCACSACDYRRSQKWNLDSRMQSRHMCEKPYGCDECGGKFQLTEHGRVVMNYVLLSNTIRTWHTR